jgi:hypothetical protein
VSLARKVKIIYFKHTHGSVSYEQLQLNVSQMVTVSNNGDDVACKK